MNSKINVITTSLIVFLIFIIVSGCGGNAPTAPGAGIQSHSVSDYPALNGNRHLLGMWQFVVDLKNPSLEIIPLREATAHVNVVGILEPAPLTYLSIDTSTLSVSVAEQIVEVDVILKHPFPMSPQFTGFDVRGIVISDGSKKPFSFDNELVMSSLLETRLVNADGYTRWWNPSEFKGKGILGYKDGLLGKKEKVIGYSSTLNGYKYFADGLGADQSVMSPLVLVNRGRFSPSSTNRRHYVLKFGPNTSDFMVFNYAVDASWELPTKMPPQSFDDFPISANALEPFNIEVIEEVNSLYYDPALTACPKSGGVLRLKINVATWQGVGGIKQVLVGSPDLGVDFFEPTEIGGVELYSAHVSTYRAEISPPEFESSNPEIYIMATSPLGSYTVGPDNSSIQFGGSSNKPLALYQVYAPKVGKNSPPVVGPVLGPTEVLAGTENLYQVEKYYDCQDMISYLTFAWEIGDDDPPLYNDGMGNTDLGIYKGGDGTISVVFTEGGIHRVDARLMDSMGLFGYSAAPLDVNVLLPESPTFTSNVDLKLSLVRTAFHSYEYAFGLTDIPYIKLEWNPTGCISGVVDEWVIYRDTNPYDGLQFWEEIGTTPAGVTTFKNLLGDYGGPKGYNSGGAYYFRVKARSLAGHSETESPNSTEWAFIEFENAEISGPNEDQHPWIMGYGRDTSVPSQWYQWERTGKNGAVSGGCYEIDPDYNGLLRHHWSVIASKPLPILTDPVLAATTKVWYIELVFGAPLLPQNYAWRDGNILSVGTTPDAPSSYNMLSFYLPYDESPPSAYYPLSDTDTVPYYPWPNPTPNWSYNQSRFDETPATFDDRHGWQKTEYGFPLCWSRFLLPGLNPAGAARTRAAIGFGTGGYDDALCKARVDEIAVIIY